MLAIECLWPKVDTALPQLVAQCCGRGLDDFTVPWSKYFLVEALSSLRRHWLQDAAMYLYQLQKPNHPLWAAVPELFTHLDWYVWQNKLKKHVHDQLEKKATATVEKVVPEVALSIHPGYARMSNKVAKLNESGEQREQAQERRHREIMQVCHLPRSLKPIAGLIAGWLSPCRLHSLAPYDKLLPCCISLPRAPNSLPLSNMPDQCCRSMLSAVLMPLASLVPPLLLLLNLEGNGPKRKRRNEDGQMAPDEE